MRQDLNAISPTAFPFTVYVEPTSECNLRCSFCGQASPDFPRRAFMPMPLFHRIADQLDRRARSIKLFHFGEPLLHPHIEEMVARLCQTGAAVELTTNGILLNRRRAEAFIRAGLDKIRLSWNAEMKLRQRRLVAQNMASLMDARREAETVKPRVVAKSFDGQVPPELACDERAAEPRHNLCGIGSEGDSDGACPYPFYTLVIAANGDALCCCLDWPHGTKVGDANTQTIEEIWRGPAMLDLRLKHLSGRRAEIPACAHCTQWRDCPDRMTLTPEEYRRRL